VISFESNVSERYPSVSAYVANLPNGLGSHPSCQVKASLLRDALRSWRIEPPEGSLPEAIATLLRDPPPVSSWLNEVTFHGAMLAIYDESFAGSHLEAFGDWIFESNLELFRKSLYRVLFAFVSPSRLVELVASRWSAFHRGTSLSLVERDAASARVKLEYPARLYDSVMLHAVASGIRAAITVAGARDARCRVDSSKDCSTEYRLSWSGG
jgi:hypothetical protein